MFALHVGPIIICLPSAIFKRTLQLIQYSGHDYRCCAQHRQLHAELLSVKFARAQSLRFLKLLMVVEDEFLNFLVTKMRTLSHDEIVLVASTNLSCEWIEESKRLLFEVCPKTSQRLCFGSSEEH